ncbi:Ankyrin-1, partial [Emericellopsis cladophorae]
MNEPRQSYRKACGPALEAVYESAEANVDIVAVHGLGSDVYWAWTWKNPADPGNPDLHVRWLQDPDMLPAVVPHSRILLYNYNSRWHKDAPKTRLSLCGEELARSVRDFREGATASRPIVFVGHSLGGNVIQHALLYANSDDALRHVATSTAGVIFLGSPLRGSHFQTLAEIAAWFSRFVGSHDGIVRDLAYDDENLMDTLHYFCRLRNTLSLTTCCFFELHKTDYAKKMLGVGWPSKERVVDEASACIPGLERRSLEANHSELNKYSGPDDRSFRSVSAELRRLCADAPAVVERRTQQKREAKECLRHLFLTDPYEDMQKMKRKKGHRAKGTCDWILGTDELTAWLGDAPESTSPATDVLWLHGNPGTGKSTMSMFLAEALSEAFSQTPNKTLAYFFCDSGYDTRKTATAVVRGLLLQLVQQHPRLIEYVLPKYEERKARAFESFDALWGMFLKACADVPTGRKYCVVDALDECTQDDQMTLLKQIKQTFGQDRAAGGLNVSFLFTSRPYSEITEHLQTFPSRDLASFKESRQDVDKFIDEKVAELGERKKYTKTVATIIARVLRDKAGGIFLWVGLACRELEDVPSRNSVIRLVTIPAGLQSLYKQLLDTALQGEDPDMVKRLLSFVMVARRPLSTRELASACNLYQDEAEEERIQFTSEVVASCRLMIVVQDDKVLLLHQSVKDFLVGDMAGSMWYVRELQVHNILASRCVQCLIANFTLEGCHQKENDDFVQYATEFWPEHAHIAQEEFQIEDNQAEFFTIESKIRDSWWENYLTSEYGVPPGLSIFHVAARWGIPLLVDYALSRKPGLAAASAQATLYFPYVDSAYRDSDGCTPLMQCAASSYINVFKRMLDRADPALQVETEVIQAAAHNQECGPKVIEALFSHKGDRVTITEDVIKAAAENEGSGAEVMRILLGQKGNQVTITEDIVEAAAENWESGEEILKVLLNWKKGQITITAAGIAAVFQNFGPDVIEALLAGKGDQIIITEGIVNIAAGNWESGEDVMKVLLTWQGGKVKITTGGVAAVTRIFGPKLMKVLLTHRGDQVAISESVILAAAKNETSAAEVMELLLAHRGDRVTITENIVKVASRNWRNGAEVMKLLLDRRAEEVTITEDVVKAAAGNSGNGAKVMKIILTQGGLGTITENGIAAVANNFGPDVTEVLLAHRGDQVTITEDIVKAAARNSAHGAQVMEVLLDRRADQIKITEGIVKVAAGNWHNGAEVMEVLQDRRGDQITITNNVVEAAAGNSGNGTKVIKILLTREGIGAITASGITALARNFGPDVAEVLLAHRGDQVTISENVLLAAAKNETSAGEVMKLLLAHREDQVTITKEIVNAAIENSGNGAKAMKILLLREGLSTITANEITAVTRNFGPDVIETLLDRREDQITITEDIVKSAARNSVNGAKVMELLLDRRAEEVTITEDIVEAAAGNWENGEQVIELLLDRRGEEFTITKGIVKAAVKNPGNGAKVIKVLLDRKAEEVTITKDIVEAAARNSAEVIEVLLDRRGDQITITEDIVEAAAGNWGNGAKVIEVLLDRREDRITITKGIVKAAVSNSGDGAEVMKVIFDRRGEEVTITEDIVKAAAWNLGKGAEVIELLLDRRGEEFTITEDIVEAAAGNSAEVIEVLLGRRAKEVTITEDIVKAAARNSANGAKVIELLLDRRAEEVTITEDIVKAAAENSGNGAQVIKVLLDRRRDQITITEDIVKAAARNSFDGAQVIEVLLDRRGEEVLITEDIVEAAAENSGNGAKVIELLLDRRGEEVTITEDIVRAAAWNLGKGAEVIELLLDRRAEEVTITENIVQAAVGNSGNGAQVIKVLLDRRGHQITITEDIIYATARNAVNGAKVIEVLLDRREDRITITKGIVEAAARNSFDGAQVIEVLLDRRGEEFTITKNIIYAAASNSGNGAKVIELLLDRRAEEVTITEDIVKAAAG